MQIHLDNSEQLIKDYLPLIKANANKFPIFEYDEMIDESKMIVIEAIGEYDEKKGSFGTLLKSKLYYHFLNKTKDGFVASLDELDSSGNPIIDGIESDFDLEADVIDREIIDMLNHAIMMLDEIDQAIIVGKYFDGQTNSDLSAKLNLSYKTVANRATLALRKLRIILEN